MTWDAVDRKKRTLTVNTTMDRYVHVTDDSMSKAVVQLKKIHLSKWCKPPYIDTENQ